MPRRQTSLSAVRSEAVELFRYAIDKLAAPIVPALCKEDQALWRVLGLPFRGCHCLLDARDPLVDEAPSAVRSLAR